MLDDAQVAEILEDLKKAVGGKKAEWSRGARVPKNVNDPDYEKRLKELKKAKAAMLEQATPAPVEVTGVFTPLYADGDVVPEIFDVAALDGYASNVAVIDALDAEIAREEQYASLGPDPVVDYLHEHGFVKGEGEGGKLYVVCPFESAHGKQHADDSQTCYLPAGTGGYFRGHVDCKDGSCDAYEDWQFLVAWGLEQYHPLAGFSAVPYTEAELQHAEEVRRMNAPMQEHATVLNALGVDTTMPPKGSANPLDAPVYDRDKQGRILVHQNNLRVFCSTPSECGYRFAKNTFTNKLYATQVDGAVPGVLEEWNDDLITDLVMRARDIGMGPATVDRKTLTFAVSLAATKYDSAIQWIRGLPVWDGVPRVEHFCSRYLGCEDSPYHRAVSLYWWTALAGRGLSMQGIQADMVPILIGPQGSGKSSTVRALVPDSELYVSLSFHTSHKELALKMFGKLVGELAELSGLRGKDMEGTKEWLTTIKDNARVPYETFPRNFARRLLFIGTTNRDDFATDTTGNRRLLPVFVGSGQDIPAIIRDRDQLWAEAAVLFDAGGIQWRDADRLGRDEHEAVMATLPVESAIAEWLTTAQTLLITNEGICGLSWGELPYLRIMDVLTGALQATKVQATQGNLPHQGGDVLRKFGYRRQQVRVDGVKFAVWLRPGIDGAVEIAEWKRIHGARAAK